MIRNGPKRSKVGRALDVSEKAALAHDEACESPWRECRCSSAREVSIVYNKWWLARRIQSMGASDGPIALGCSPYANADPWVLAQQKRGRIPPDNDRALTFGHYMERTALRWLEDEIGGIVDFQPERDEFATICALCGERAHSHRADPVCWNDCPDPVFFHANLDGRIEYQAETCNVEIKTVSFWNPGYEEWKRDGVPRSVQIQVQHQMLCSGLQATLIILVNLSAGKFELRVVPADREMQQLILDRLTSWWQKCVQGDEEPEPAWTQATEDALLLMFPKVEESAVVELDDQLHDDALAWVAAKETQRDAEKLAEALRRKLLKSIAPAATGKFPGGATITQTQNKRGRVLRYHPFVEE